MRVRQVVPDLEQALAAEANADTRRNIEFELKLLTDGYILAPDGDRQFLVTTFTDDGGIIASRVAGSELERLGIDAIVVELAKQR